MVRAWLVGLCAVVCAGVGSAAEPAPPAEMLTGLDADAAVLEHAYRMLHPGLLRYLNEPELKRNLASLRSSLADGASLAQTYLAFSRFAATIKCGHTYANFFNQRRDIQVALFESTPRLPFYFEWLNGRMVVTQDFSAGKKLSRGTEVLSINGTSVAQVIEAMLPFTRADGSNDAKRIAQLGVRGDSIYEPFDVFYPMLFRFQSGSIDLWVRRPGEHQTSMIRVQTLSFAQRIAPIDKRESSRKGGGNDPQFEWVDRSDGSAYVRMPTWALFNSHWDWREWLDERLDRLIERSGSALIIDLRGNEGGQDVGDALLVRLIRSDVTVNQSARLVRFQHVPDDLMPYLDTWDPTFKDLGRDAAPLDPSWPTAPSVGYFRLPAHEVDGDSGTTLHPHPKPYRGRVLVLVDANNSSATFQFAQIIQDNHLGILVGQQTGGNRRGINGGAFFFLRLPVSRIELDLPLIGTFPATEQPDAGLMPDIVTARTVRDIAAGRDVELAAVKRSLQKGGTP